MPEKYTLEEIKQIMQDIEYRIWEVDIIDTIAEEQDFSYHTMRLIFTKISNHLKTLGEQSRTLGNE